MKKTTAISAQAFRLGWVLGTEDLRDVYRRTKIGPFWSSLGLGVQILTISLIFGFALNHELSGYVLHLSTGLVFWSFTLQTAIESSYAFQSSERLLKQIQISLFVPVLRVLMKNFLLLLHNLLILGIVMLIARPSLNLMVFAALPGAALLAANIFWISVLIAIMGSRFRDFSPMLSSLFTVAFYLTPIIWMPKNLPDSISQRLLAWNPMFHLLDVVRSPLQGVAPSVTSWLVCTLAAAGGFSLMLFAAKRLFPRVIFWL